MRKAVCGSTVGDAVGNVGAPTGAGEPPGRGIPVVAATGAGAAFGSAALATVAPGGN